MTTPPLSPLFPYTTLFRSEQPAAEEPQQWAEPTEQSAAETAPEIDRKSTRLNSSHVAISYAVFCLKKKNNRTTTHRVDHTQQEISKILPPKHKYVVTTSHF